MNAADGEHLIQDSQCRFSEVMPGLARIIKKGVIMSQIGEPLRIIEVEPREEPVPEKEVPFEQPADPVKEPA